MTENKGRKIEFSQSADGKVNIRPQLSDTPKISIKIVPPHKKRSRAVKNADIKRMLDDAEQMAVLMDRLVKNGTFKEIYALAHPQIDDEDPLCFFVVNVANENALSKMPDQDFLIVNPRIVRHTRHTVRKDEGCVTFPTMGQIRMDRYHKMDIEYKTIEETADGDYVLTGYRKASVSGIIAQMFQHEIDHFKPKWIHKLTIKDKKDDKRTKD